MCYSLAETEFNFYDQRASYRGKVRDIYIIRNLLVMVVTDRISAFDVILPRTIPFKGQILNKIAEYFLDTTEDIVLNWKIATPDPNVMIGHLCDPIPIEMIVRGYLSGHAWRIYNSGHREICGIKLPDGLKENDQLNKAIITPTTKAKQGHDQDVSKDEIIRSGLVSADIYEQMEYYSLKLFERGTELAQQKGLILVDTKYEFGLRNGQLVLIDEVHTPDSSRYFYLDEYFERQKKAIPQKQLSKEFVREWLMQQGFQGKEGQTIPQMTDEIVQNISERYIELYEKLTGNKFVRPENDEDIHQRIYKNIQFFLSIYFNRIQN